MGLRQLLPDRVDDVDPAPLYDIERQAPEHRPYVVVNMVASVDGATMVHGATAPLSNPSDRSIFGILRAAADVILVGAQTVRVENYGPPRIGDSGARRRLARGRSPSPRVAVVTRSLDLDWAGRLFGDPEHRPLVLAPETTALEDLTRAAEVADVVTVGDGAVDVGRALQELRRQGVEVVLCEGGPILNQALAEAQVIDELCLTVSAVLAGEDSGRLLAAAHLDGLVALELRHLLEHDGCLFLRYTAREWPSTPAVDTERDIDRRSIESLPVLDDIDDVVSDLDYPMLVVTAEAGGDRQGCLVGFAAQCSINPPRFTVWISKKNRTATVARRAKALAVHFLSVANEDLARLFGESSGDQIDKFERCRWHSGAAGAPVLDDCARWFVGRVVSRHDDGDHVAVLLEPVAAQAGPWRGQLGFQMTRHLHPSHDA